MIQINVTLNGVPRQFSAAPAEKVRDLLRREGIFSVRNGCDGMGVCGSCAIIMDGKVVNSCLLLAPQIDGKKVYTVDALAKNKKLSAVQSALIDTGMVQCGYCTPALVVRIHELLQRVSAPTREDIKDALSGHYCRCTGYEPLFAAVALAVERLNNPEQQANTIPEFRDDLKIVGKLKRKVDGPRLARGEAAYVEDMVRPGSCHLKMLRSPHAHAYIKSIDTSEAEAMPGVVFVATHKNGPDVWYNQAGQGAPEPSPYDRKLFDQKMRHVGDRVAAVVAETEEIAAAAIRKIKVAYDVLEPVLNIDEAAADGAPLVHNAELEFMVGAPDDLDNSQADPREGKIIYPFPIHADPRRNIAAHVDGGIGDIDKGFAEADVVIEREYESARVQCVPREPHVVYTRMENERLIIHASTQVPFHLRRITAYVLGIDENKIRVIKERVGGGFGSKQDIVLEEVAAYCTWVTGRAILFRFSRREEFIASRTRHVMRVKVKLGAKKDGTLTGVLMELKADTGPYGAHCLTVPMNACSKALPLIVCDNVRFDVTTYYTTTPLAGAYQGYGAPKGSYALQLALAELAAELKMDHVALLEKNRVREGTKCEILRCLGEGREGIAQVIESCGLGPALEQGTKMINWGTREESGDPDVKIGKGVAIIQQGSGLPGLDLANADVAMLSDGTFMIYSGGADLGTGLDTVTTKMVAECLCVPMAKVSVISGDTDATPFDVGSYASSGTYFSGGAAYNAAKDLKVKILGVAAEMLEEDAGGLTVEAPGLVKGEKGAVSYKEIAKYCETGTGRGHLEGHGTYITDKGSFPYGAHFVQVAVNTRTGKATVQKYYALQDCGTPVNPEYAVSQIYGGVLKTIGSALFEEIILDDKGRCLNASLVGYKVPMINDLPDDFQTKLVYTDDPLGPYGAKSVSEIACNGAAPAIAEAIHDAVGVWPRTWPFSPEKILRLMGKLQ